MTGLIRKRLVAFARFLAVLFFFLLPALGGFVGAVFKLTFGGRGGLFGMLREFVGGLTGFERGGVSVAFLPFPLGLPLSFARVRTGAQREGDQ